MQSAGIWPSVVSLASWLIHLQFFTGYSWHLDSHRWSEENYSDRVKQKRKTSFKTIAIGGREIDLNSNETRSGNILKWMKQWKSEEGHQGVGWSLWLDHPHLLTGAGISWSPIFPQSLGDRDLIPWGLCSKGWFPGPQERESWVVEDLHLKGQRKYLQPKVF